MAEATVPPLVLTALVNRFREGRVVPFLGAGASAYAASVSPAPPAGGKLLELMATALQIQEKDGMYCVQHPCPRPPDNREPATSQPAELLVCAALGQCRRPLVDLARVASVFQSKYSRADLNDFLREEFKTPFKPNLLHVLLAAIARTRPMLIVTTNYDTMIEDAFDHADGDNPPVAYDVVATDVDQLDMARSRDPLAPGSAAAGVVWHRRGGQDPTPFTQIAPSEVTCDLRERSMIYKIHGSLRPGAAAGSCSGDFLIAEEDYVRFLGSMAGDEVVPAAIRTQLLHRARDATFAGGKDAGRTMLFLGYGLQDWNMRVLLDNLNIGKGRNAQERHYLIDLHPNLLQKMVLEAQGTFSVFEMDLADFVNLLGERWRR